MSKTIMKYLLALCLICMLAMRLHNIFIIAR